MVEGGGRRLQQEFSMRKTVILFDIFFVFNQKEYEPSFELILAGITLRIVTW